MNRIVLLMETGRAATKEAAKWFAEHGDIVYIGVKAAPVVKTDGVEYLVFDPCTGDGMQAAVETVEQKHGKLDIFVMGASCHPEDGVIGSGHDYEQYLDVLMENICGNRTAVEAFLPLLRLGMKRVANITEVESSNNWSTGKTDMAYHASLAGLNVTGKMVFNKLRPEGFTFRWYCDDGVPGGMCAAEYITSALCYDPKEPYTHSDENRLVLRDAYLREIAW